MGNIPSEFSGISDIQNLVSSFVGLVNGTYTNGNRLAATINRWIVSDADRYFLNSKNELIADARKLSSNLELRNNLESFLKIARIVWEFVQEVRKTVEEEKVYLNTLDFDDLQLKVLKLLDNPKVVEKIVSQIGYIMIDEFQDTNELQYNIVRKLVPELFDSGSDIGINLFVVGDAKQSIYGFRNADVRVFNKVVEDILRKNTALFNSNAIADTIIKAPERTIEMEEQLGKNRLASTFRLRPEIAAFVNLVCSKIMKPELSTYEVEYSPLVCSKDTDKIEINNGAVEKSGNMGKVVFLLSKNLNEKQEDAGAESENNEGNESTPKQIFRIDTSADSSERPEENLIANYIQSIVGTKLEGREQAIEYKDIAILARRRTKFPVISSELLVKNIPFLIHSGKGFFNTEEIADFINFLKFIYNPDDDISFISILRSPFFNFDDRNILILKNITRNRSVWQNLKKNAASDDKFKTTLAILEDILAVASTTSISKVILLIMEKTGWSGLIAGKPARHQIMANIDKFIEIARSYENIGFKNIYDFVEELKFISEQEIGESEAAILTNENAVNIMTIHASKGLQFPVVILYDSNSGVGGNSPINISEELGIGFKISIPSTDVFEHKVDNILNIINKDIRKKSEQAEAKRVLYVAMTRAEEILVISSLAKVLNEGLGNPRGQFDLILNGLDLSIQKLYEVENIKRITSLDIRKDRRIISADYEMCIETIHYPFLAASTYTDKEISTLAPTILLDNISSTQNGEYFSPSKLMSFKHDETEYFNSYILGLNSQEFSEPENNDNDDEAAGRYIGLEIHKVLESITEWLKDDLSVDDLLLKQKIAFTTSSSTFNESHKAHSRIYDECVNIAMTDLIKREYRYFKQGKSEIQLSIPFGENILFGIIDLYFKASTGEYEIWDWKSNQIESIEEKDKLVAKYESQMLVYAYLISRLHPEIDTLKARLLFTRLARQNSSETEWTHTFSWRKKELETCRVDIENNIMEIRNKLYLWLD